MRRIITSVLELILAFKLEVIGLKIMNFRKNNECKVHKLSFIDKEFLEIFIRILIKCFLYLSKLLLLSHYFLLKITLLILFWMIWTYEFGAFIFFIEKTENPCRICFIVYAFVCCVTL